MQVECCSAPFRHWLLRGVIPPEVLAAARAAVPEADWPGWVRYANDVEQKRTTRNGLADLPPTAGDLFRGLCGWGFVSFLRHLTGVPELLSDPSLWGAGLHVSDPGDYLSPHLDFDAHPRMPGCRRRLNLVAFLNERWEVAWGGAFQLCSAAGEPVKEIHPEPGLVVVWEASDVSYHAATEVTGPESRLTAACYYMAPAPKPATRTRALFVPRRV